MASWQALLRAQAAGLRHAAAWEEGALAAQAAGCSMARLAWRAAAASHSFFTSIGTRCIQRFVRPVCYQDCPDAQLPMALQNANPRGVWRLVDGKRTNEALEF